MVGFTYAPRGWAMCVGSIVASASNSALFSLLGSAYGGNGTTTFALPDLRSRVPIHFGPGTGGLSTYVIGQIGGVESVVVTTPQLSMHAHQLSVSTSAATSTDPTNHVIAASSSPLEPWSQFPATGATAMIGGSGSGGAHENRMPYQAVTFVIATTGTYPARN